MLTKGIDAYWAGCLICKGKGWVCANHPNMGWPDECDCGAGMLCVCNAIDEDSLPDVTGLYQSVVRRRALGKPPPFLVAQPWRTAADGSSHVKAVRGTLRHMMWRWQYWHFGVTWTQWKLEYRYDWCDSPLWTIRVGPLWILLH